MLRTFIPVILLSLGLAACHTNKPQPVELPPIMDGEARFLPMSSEQQTSLRNALEPFLSAETPAEVYFLAPRRKDDGSFPWCVSPAEEEGEWVSIGSLSPETLRKLAEESTTVEHGGTLDYWQSYELRCGSHRLPVSTCPAEEFGVHIQGCSPVRSRSLHRELWKLMERRFDIQRRFDQVVQF